MANLLGTRETKLTLSQKLLEMNWGVVLLIIALASVGFVMLYSVASGNIEPWAKRQMVRFAVGMMLMFAVALVDIRMWIRYAYVIYGVGLVLLVGVDVMGTVGMGAQRWIDLGVFQLQPSEIVKIALVLALARYFHTHSLQNIRRLHYLLVPALMVAAPVALVLKQPDLGTAILLIMGGGALFLLAGVRMWIFAVGAVAAVASVPIAWQFLREYQKSRVLTFLNPERDPLGAGYHITQSKIALGAGGLFGKGYMQGTQSYLNFLPEKQTDFIFTMLAEEFGMIGGLVLLSLYVLLFAYGFIIALQCRSQFGRLVAMGVTVTMFLYVFINMAMVMGLVPVVGVPLPLVSYGGTAMMTILIGYGLVMSVYIHRETEIPRGSV